ncbi:MAG TPA: LEA type 2 family protein [Polyangiaceae bacterium]|nr:LEA type 2 family protein [Polyangiaceae bacterium]HMR80953.1 LEA type 2 family protein [Polyangiaceae bacterium]
MRRASFLVLILTAVLAAACSKPKPPKITPHAAKVTGITATGLTLSCDLDVENPNAFPIIVRRVNGKFLIGSGVEVGTAEVKSSTSVGAGKTERVPSSLDIAWSNLGALAALGSSPQVDYTFEGLANVGTDKWNVDVPFRLKGQLTRTQLVNAGLRGFSMPAVPTAP